MGVNITRDARIKFNKERADEINSIRTRYKNLETRSVLMVGPPQSGKTQLFRNLLNHEFEDVYNVDESAKFGFKVFSTIQSKYKAMNPLRVELMDAPGAMTRNNRGVDFYFEKCNIILIVMDITLELVDTKIERET